MNWIRNLIVTGAVLVFTAVPARADVFIAAIAGAATGGALDGSKPTYGGQLGFLGGMFGVEGDYGFTTKTRGGKGGDNFRTWSGSVLFAPMWVGSDKFRPYLSAGGGTIGSVSEVKHILAGDETTESAGVLSAGGGMFAFMSSKIGIRLDARYMKAMLERADPDDKTYFVRVTGGLVVRF